MSAVSGTRRTMKELVDGTIRVQIDIDPLQRAQFLKLFPSIDMPVALAPLHAGFEQEERKAPPQRKGQTLSQYAAMLCSDSRFEAFLQAQYPVEWAQFISARAPGGEHCAAVMRVLCDVESRAEFDSDPEAAKRFHALREEYHEWLQEVA